MASCVEITEIKIPHTRPILSGTPGDFNRTDLWDDHQLRNLPAFRSLKKMVLILSSKKSGSYVVAKTSGKTILETILSFYCTVHVCTTSQKSIISAFRLPKVQIWSRITLRSVETQAVPLNHDGRKGESFLKLNMKRDFFRRDNIELSLNLLPIFWKPCFLMPRICIKTSVVGDLFHHLPFFVELPLQCQLSRWESPPQASTVAACCSKCRSGGYIPWKFKL